MLRNFTLFLLFLCSFTAGAQTAEDCTPGTATLIINGLDLIEADQPYTNGDNRTYCFNTEVGLNLPDGIGVVRLTSDSPEGYPYKLFVTDKQTNLIDTLSAFGDSVLIREGQLYFVEIMPTRTGTGDLALVPVPILVALGGAPDTITIEITGFVCPPPVESFTCGDQSFARQRDALSTFTFSTADETYPAGGDWTINGASYTTISTAALLENDVLTFEIPGDGTYEICYETLDDDGCTNYCCRTYCLDATPVSEDISFSLRPDGTAYDITLGVPEATEVSFYGGQPAGDGVGTTITVPLPSGDCYTTDYTFRYQEGGCWKTARTQVFICDPYECNDVSFDFSREEEAWNLFLAAATVDTSPVTWFDDDNGGVVLASATTSLRLDPRAAGECGPRNITLRYFDGASFRYCGLRFGDCDPYDCNDITSQENEEDEALDLIFTGANATQISWIDDATGQVIPGSTGHDSIALPWPVEGCDTSFITVRYFDTETTSFRLCGIEAEACRPDPCGETTLSFSCGNQQFFQTGINGGANFTFSTTDPAHPDQANWRINGNDLDDVSYANLLTDGTLVCDFPAEGNYEICYATIDEEGCEDYCCRNYCVDFEPPLEPTVFELANDGQGYTLSFSLAGATDVSWYAVGQPDLEGTGRIIEIPFPTTGACFYQAYYFRYFEEGCWKTALRTVFVCNPFNCNDVDVAFSQQNEAWNLSFTAPNANSVSWIDENNGSTILATGTTALRLNPRPQGTCGIRNISVRYSNGLGWRFCTVRFWDCNPYECSDIASQTNEANESLDLIFTGANAIQLTWQDEITGQALTNSNGQTGVSLPWPVVDCQTRRISVNYFDTALNIFRTCSVVVDVCRPEQCSEDFINCGNLSYFRSGSNSYTFSTSEEVAEDENWLINGVPAPEVNFPVSVTAGMFSASFPAANTYELCYPFLDEEGCVDYCCEEYCIDVDSNEDLIGFTYQSATGSYRLRLDVAGASQITWYYLNNAGNIQESGPGATATASVPVGGDCFDRTYYFAYADASGCPRTAFRRVRICDPAACDEISYRYDRANGEYDLTFTGSAQAGSLQWLNDDADGATLNSSTEQQSIPLQNGACGPRNVSVRYFDGASWNICAFRYWACDPYLCDDLTVTNDTDNEWYVFAFTGSNAATEISWQDEVSGSEIAGSNGLRDIVLPYPEQGCETRSLSIRYFDPGFGGYRTCAVEQELCRPEICGNPAFNANCNNQDYFLREDGAYRFTANTSLANGQAWLVNGNSVGTGDATGITLNLPAGLSYEVCYPFFDGNGCLNYCCRTYCIDSQTTEAITFSYENNGNTLRLALSDQEATSIDWYFFDNSLRTSLGNGTVITPAIPQNCGYVTYYVRYFAGGCWKVATQTIWACNPLNCGDISYAYDAANEGFNLELNATGTATSVSWIDEDTEVILSNNDTQLFLPLANECGVRNVSVRYFDGTGWRICGLRLSVCDPFACGDISYNFMPNSDAIEFELAGVDNATEIFWADSDSGQPLPGNANNTTLIWDGDCRVRNITARYRDPATDAWRVCSFRFFACAPEACASSISFELAPNNEVLIATDESFTDLSWSVDGAAAGAETVLSTVIMPGQSRTICVRYFDPANGYYRTCCRTITVPDCEPLTPAFRIELNVDTITVVNESLQADVTYFWAFGDVATSTLPQPLPLHLPPGPHIICLRVTNACGFERICQTIVIPDPANALVLELGEAPCAPSGEIVSVPLMVRNFTDIISFRSSLRLPSPRYGRFLGLRHLNENGTGVFSVVNDSTLTTSWVRTNPQGGTLTNGTIIGLVDILLTGNQGGTGAVAFSDAPTQRSFELADGQSSTPRTTNGSYELCLPTGSISGRIRTEAGAGVGQVIVLLQQNGLNVQSLTTDETGVYRFANLQPGREYRVTPLKNIGYRNGVTAGDLSRMQRHLTQRPELATPYQRIAADVNAPGQINIDDIEVLRQLIFQESSALADVNSWAFVPLAYSFPNPGSPHDPAYPRELDFTAGRGETTDQDFIGMKMGDIGDSADPEGLSNTGPGLEEGVASNLLFDLNAAAPMRDQAYEVDVRASNFTAMFSAQLSLSWNGSRLRLDSLSNLNDALGLNEESFSTVGLADGRLPCLWFADTPVSLADSSVLFTLHFTVTGAVGEEVAVSFTEDPTEFSFEDAEDILRANFTDLRKLIELPTSTRSPLTVKEWRVFPNPTTDEVRVKAIGSSFGPEQLELFDSRGRSVRKWAAKSEGNYSVAGLPAGVYQLWLSSSVGAQVTRLVVF
jgi:hypothetical protein